MQKPGALRVATPGTARQRADGMITDRTTGTTPSRRASSSTSAPAPGALEAPGQNPPARRHGGHAHPGRPHQAGDRQTEGGGSVRVDPTPLAGGS